MEENLKCRFHVDASQEILHLEFISAVRITMCSVSMSVPRKEVATVTVSSGPGLGPEIIFIKIGATIRDIPSLIGTIKKKGGENSNLEGTRGDPLLKRDLHQERPLDLD